MTACHEITIKDGVVITRLSHVLGEGTRNPSPESKTSQNGTISVALASLRF